MKKNLVVLSGAGVSAESGLKTFRDSDGLWEGHRIEDVATPEAWRRDPGTVLEFYNQRRRALRDAEPNKAHHALVRLESKYNVSIITQNVDDLHERAGSSQVLHLHGELRKAQSTRDPNLIYDLQGSDIALGDRCELGAQLRPFIVWFGEAVPAIKEALAITKSADVFIVVGTSLLVYPAAGLVDEVSAKCSVYLVDPNPPSLSPRIANLRVIAETAVKGVESLVEELLRSVEGR